MISEEGGSPPGPRGHWPQLDGIRAVAISVVVAYHLGDLPGGWLGVDVFFVLSGYLITWILLTRGQIGNLGWFWARRARRLLPAVLLVLGALSVYAWLSGPGLVPAQLRTPALATLLYTANWQQIVGGHSYFAHYAAPNPLEHTWSLAIEEQYYLLWPLLLAGLLRLFRHPAGRRPRRAVLLITLGLAAASAAWMGWAAHAFDPNRAYLGTDTRAWELLIGGAAAMCWPPGQPAPEPGRARWMPSAAVLLGAASLAAGVASAGGPPSWIWDGGLVAIALGSAGLIVGSIRAPSNAVSRLLATAPLRWLGRVSYSLYLWHWPVIVLMRPDTTGLGGVGLLVSRLAAMTAAASASYYLVEQPLRTYNWSGLAARLHLPRVAFPAAGLIATAALVAAGSVGPGRAPSAAVAADQFDGPTPAERAVRLDVARPEAGLPYRVWILGDSVMFDASLGVQAALEATGKVSVVADTAFPGWSPLRDTHWPADAEQTIATYHPQIVVGTWSWDDEAAAADPQGYQAFLERAIGTLLAPGNGVQAVVLLQFPQVGPAVALGERSATSPAWSHQTAVQRAWDRAAARAVTAFPGRALYLTTDRAFAPGGRFYTWLRGAGGGWVRARKLDNAHMCPYGAAVFGALVSADLGWYLGLPATRPGWEGGAWTRDHRYDDPPGACPADQPPRGYMGAIVPP